MILRRSISAFATVPVVLLQQCVHWNKVVRRSQAKTYSGRMKRFSPGAALPLKQSASRPLPSTNVEDILGESTDYLARECPIQITDNIVNILNTHREPYTAICNAEFLALTSSQVAMRRHRRITHLRVDITESRCWQAEL